MAYPTVQNILAYLSKSLPAHWGCFQGKSGWENHCWLCVNAESFDIGSQLPLLPSSLILICYVVSDAPVKRIKARDSFLGQMAFQTWRSCSDLADTRLHPPQCQVALHLARVTLGWWWQRALGLAKWSTRPLCLAAKRQVPLWVLQWIKPWQELAPND